MRITLRRSGKNAALALLMLSLFAPAASAAPGMEVALQDDYVFVSQYYHGREQALTEARQLGVTRLRVNVNWATVARRSSARRAPASPAYDWSAYDGLIADARRYGIRLQMALTGPAPAWATGDHRVGIREVRASAYGRFARDAAAHFRGSVDRYSIWNEPNWHTWLQPSKDCRKGRWGARCDARLGALYRNLFLAGSKAVRRADPAASVLFGEMAPQAAGTPKQPTAYATAPLVLLRAVTCSTRAWKRAQRCPKLVADGFAHHPYAFTTPPGRTVGGRDDVTLASLGRLTKALDRLSRRGALRTPSGRPMELYLTEYGYLQSTARRLPESTRARYLIQSFDRALAAPRVRQMLQYMLVGPPPQMNGFPTQLLNHDGSPTPSFVALAEWSARHAPAPASVQSS